MIEIALHEWFCYDDDERDSDAEFTNAWVELDSFPLEDLKDADERTIVDAIYEAVMNRGRWILPDVDYQVSAELYPDNHQLINRVSLEHGSGIYYESSFEERIKNFICIQGWHIVQQREDGRGYDWLGQGSSFCEPKLINV